jgi:hypothetical protein
MVERSAYEKSDVSARGILGIAGALTGAAIVIHGVVWWLLLGFSAREEARSPVSPAVVNPGRRPEDRVLNLPEPRLEGLKSTRPQTDAKRLAAEPPSPAERLDEYGWVDEKNGIARIPIEVAMKVYVELQRAKGRP